MLGKIAWFDFLNNNQHGSNKYYFDVFKRSSFNRDNVYLTAAMLFYLLRECP